MRSLNRDGFPPLLKEIPDPPEKLYVRGEVPESDEYKLLAVVGSRKASPYGKAACEKLIAGLAGYPVVIVSGLALGIDSIAHRAALSAGLKTVAVPGSGLHPKVLYPASHTRLANEILEKGGALLSEFEPDFIATPWSFPQRNRIMAGMSHATLVIEATLKSGTLITSKFATEYNRDVMTVPGSVFSSQSEGPHMLIRLGATPVRASVDILEALGLKEKEEKVIDTSDCSREELKVLELLASPMNRGDLMSASGLSVTQGNIVLSMLELKGLITEYMGEVRRI